MSARTHVMVETLWRQWTSNGKLDGSWRNRAGLRDGTSRVSTTFAGNLPTSRQQLQRPRLAQHLNTLELLCPSMELSLWEWPGQDEIALLATYSSLNASG
jgi:hypothetical protein